MIISMDDISKINNNEIFNLVKEDLDIFYSNYENIVISIDEFYEIVLEEIEVIKTENNKEIDFLSYLLSKVTKRIKMELEIKGNPKYQNFISDIKKYDVLSQDEMKRLIPLAQSGDEEAMKILVRHNLKLVLSATKSFINRGVDFEDLVQEGTIGLIEAIKRHDLTTKFSTYALYWIKRQLFKSVYYDSRNVRIPVNQYEQLRNYRRAYEELFKILNREPTIDEIAEKMEIPYEKCLKIYQLQSDTISLEINVGKDDDDECELGSFIESDEKVEDSIEKESLKESLYYALSNSGLTEKEKITIIYRFGLNGTKKMTLEEIGKMLNVTRERVRQCEKIGLAKLKDANYKNKLDSYLYDKKPEEKERKSIDSLEYKKIRKLISPEIFDYFYRCELNALEMIVLSLSFGIIDNKIYNNNEIAIKTKKNSFYISQILNIALSKLKNDEMRNEIFKNADGLLSSNKKEQIVKPEKSIYEVIGCNEKELRFAKALLTIEELDLLNKRESESYKLIMTNDELFQFNKKLLNKIRRIIRNQKKVDIKKTKEFLEMKNSIKQFEHNVDPDLNNIIDKISDTKLFKELINHFSIKETIAIMMLNGYVFDSVYSADYVSKLLNIPIQEIFNAFKKATIVLKYINIDDIEKVKRLTINRK